MEIICLLQFDDNNIMLHQTYKVFIFAISSQVYHSPTPFESLDTTYIYRIYIYT